MLDLIGFAKFYGEKIYGKFELDTISIKIDRNNSNLATYEAGNNTLILTKAPIHVGTEIYSDHSDVYRIADIYDAANNDFQIKHFFGAVQLKISDTLGEDVQHFQFIRIMPEKDTETITN